MLRLTLVLSVIIALSLAGSSSRDRSVSSRDRDRGDRRGDDTTMMPMTTRRNRGDRGDSSDDMTTRPPRGGRRDTTTRAPRGGKGGNVDTTTRPPRGGKGVETTTRPPRGGKGVETTTEAPRGGKGGNTDTTTRPPRGGDDDDEDCDDALPRNVRYTTLINALYDDNENAINIGADALEAYETMVTDNLTYRQYVRTPMRNLVNTLIADGYPDSLRFLLTLQDGTVIFDSNRGDENTYDRSIADNNMDRINENHNSRIAILVAQMSECGIGYEQKLSSSTGNREFYLAVRVFDRYASFGTVRASYTL